MMILKSNRNIVRFLCLYIKLTWHSLFLALVEQAQAAEAEDWFDVEVETTISHEDIDNPYQVGHQLKL